MAFAKGRSNKRSSSSSSSSSPASYASTITIVVFIALCVLGVWMLTSDSIMPPQTTTRSTTTTPDRSTPTFEDNPGELPEETIKSDENKESSQEEQTPIIEASNEAEQSYEKNQEAEQENNKTEENQSEIVEENSQGLKGKESDIEQEKQKENETQTSEESSVTLNQQAEQNDHDNQMVTTSTDTIETEKNTKQTSNGDSSNSKNQEQNQNNDNKETSETSLDTDTQSTEEEKKQIIQQQQQDLKEDSIIDNTTQPQTPSEETQQKIDETTTNNTQSEKEKEKETESQQKQSNTDQETTKQSDPNQDKTKESNPDEETTKQTNPNQETTKQTNPDQATTKQSTTKTSDDKTTTDSKPVVTFPNGENSGIPKESKESKKSWSTQADQSENEKERRKDGTLTGNDATIYGYTWQLCNVTAGYDYIPCLDNEKAIKQLRSTKHYEHRERHCPEVGPTCLVLTPEGYKRPIEWPQSRDKIWYHNVPHTKLAEVKGHQNWVKVTGEFLTFPGGGTQFIHGALHYVDFVEQSVPNIAWGKHTRVILDVGCGVASFGGFLFERGVLTMSFAPKDEHEAQVQFALERGIPAISAVMGSQRLPFPSRVFDLIHCARCRVPWHENGGALLLELNRVLRPGGYFVWSATPVYQKLEEDVEIWNAMSSLTVSMCWELVTIQKDQLNSIGAAIYRKPDTNVCYDQRKQNRPPMCKNDDDSNAAWYVPLQPCMHRAPIKEEERGSRWPEEWPKRIQTPPYWLNSSQMGIYGKPAPTDFATDYEHWKKVVNNLYFNGLGISWDNVRNVMDMRAVYGGFAAALKDLQVWVFNVVNVDSPDTLPIIYERGLFGIYHDWCESFSIYPRTYDLLHADHLFSRVKKRCKMAPLMAEIDRIVRPGGKLIVRDESSTVGEVENMLKSLHWEVHLTFSKDQEGILSARKTDWRPDTYAVSS